MKHRNMLGMGAAAALISLLLLSGCGESEPVENEIVGVSRLEAEGGKKPVSPDTAMPGTGTSPQPGLCPDVVEPVCGSDGKTYQNSCEALYADVRVVGKPGCDGSEDKSDSAATLVEPQPPADSTPDPVANHPCFTLDEPVCGEDQVTYRNRCMAGMYRVAVAYAGKCDILGNGPSPKGTDIANCPMVYAPVCGKDGKTYSNSCMAGDVEVIGSGRCR